MYHYKDDKAPLSHQYISLKKYQNGQVEICDKDRSIYWEGTIKPQPFSREYVVAIKYTIGSVPICVVKSPSLEQLAAGREIPHIYPKHMTIPGTVLCLYLPNLKSEKNISEWLPKDLIADTIIPWAALWLTYFEDWLLTDDWQGGGVEHE